jgi:hypothetical protein
MVQPQRTVIRPRESPQMLEMQRRMLAEGLMSPQQVQRGNSTASDLGSQLGSAINNIGTQYLMGRVDRQGQANRNQANSLAQQVLAARLADPNGQLDASAFDVIGNEWVDPQYQQIIGSMVSDQYSPKNDPAVEVYDPATGGKRFVRQSEAFGQMSEGPKAPDYHAPINIGGVLYDPNDPTKMIADYSAQEIAARRANADNINMPGNPTPDEIGRGEFAKQNAAAQAKYFDNVATAGAQAQTRMGDINQLTQLIEMTPQGAGQEYLNKGAAVLSRFGVDLGEYANVPAAQAFQSIVSRIAPTLRVAGSGATSDFEMQQFLSSLPAIANMQGGNRIIAGNLKKLSERSVQEAYIASQVQGGDLTPAQGRKKILDLGPLNLDLPTFGGAPQGGPGGAPGGYGGGAAPGMGGTPSANDPLRIRGQ